MNRGCKPVWLCGALGSSFFILLYSTVRRQQDGVILRERLRRSAPCNFEIPSSCCCLLMKHFERAVSLSSPLLGGGCTIVLPWSSRDQWTDPGPGRKKKIFSIYFLQLPVARSTDILSSDAKVHNEFELVSKMSRFTTTTSWRFTLHHGRQA